MKTGSVVLCLFVILALAGCGAPPSSSRSPELTFANLQPVALNVAKIEVRDDYKPPLKEPNVEHLFQTPLYAAAENLLKKQLAAAGHDDILRVIITDASVMRESLPMTKGFWGAFTHQPAERLKARVVVRFELASPQAPDIVIRHIELTAKRTKTLMDGLSIADRDNAYFSLTEDMMNDLNGGLTTMVKNSFGKNQ
jgi:hypothetical protein